MIRVFLITLALIYLTLPSAAQTVSIRSGEHDSFSRLTLELPERIEWTIEQVDQRAYIRFKSSTLIVNADDVFDRIPRDRLSSILWDSEKRQIDLQLACDCRVNGFWFGKALLVLDISDAKATSPDSTALEKPAKKNLLKTPKASHAASLLSPISSLESELQTNQLSQQSPATDTPENSILSDAQDRLLQQLSRAAAQGLISPNPTQFQSMQEPDTGSVDRASDPQENLYFKEQKRLNINVNSRIDLDFLGTLTEVMPDTGLSGCLSQQEIDVSSWGNDSPFGTQISSLRLRLTGEFDAVDEKVALDLARLYLFFGFGIEARQVLALLPKSRSKLILLDLAEIADQGFVSVNTIFNDQMHCDSDVALWSALSYDDLPTDHPANTDAILRGFNGLPVHLRMQYGPILAIRLRAAGLDNAADRVHRILDRPNLPLTPAAELAKAQAELSDGDFEAGKKRLQEVVETNADVSVEALVLIIEERIKHGEGVSFDQAQLIGAYAFEKQNDPSAPMLLATYVRALAASGAFDQAFEQYAENQERLDQSDLSMLRSDMLRLLEGKGGDIEFLSQVFMFQDQDLKAADPAVVNSIAERLLKLGFPERAKKILEEDSTIGKALSRDRRILRAEAALAISQPRQAIVELLGLEGDDVEALRNDALMAAGENPAPSYAINDKIAASTETSARTAPGLAPSQPVLAANRELVSGSEDARATISALLADNPTPKSTPSEQ